MAGTRQLCIQDVTMHFVSNEIFWNSVLFHVFLFQACATCVAKKKNEMFPETNVHSKTQTFVVVSQCFIKQTLMERHVSELYVTALPQNQVEGGRVCPLKFLVFAPPSFLVSLPYANTGIRSESEKRM